LKIGFTSGAPAAGKRAKRLRLERMILFVAAGISADRQEAFAEGLRDRDGVPGLGQASRVSVDAEDDCIVAVLIGEQNPTGRGIERKITRSFSSTRVAFDERENKVLSAAKPH
jgi:hypothetical protein